MPDTYDNVTQGIAEAIHKEKISWNTLLNYSKQSVDKKEKELIKSIIEEEGLNVSDIVIGLEDRLETVNAAAEKLRELVENTKDSEHLLYHAYNEISKYLYETADKDIDLQGTGYTLICAKTQLLEGFLVGEEDTINENASIEDARNEIGTFNDYQAKALEEAKLAYEAAQSAGIDPEDNESFNEYAAIYGISIGKKDINAAKMATLRKIHINPRTFKRLNKGLKTMSTDVKNINRQILDEIIEHNLIEVQEDAQKLLEDLGY